MPTQEIMIRVAVLAVLLLASCSPQQAEDLAADATQVQEPTSSEPTPPLIGFSLSPASYDESGFAGFFEPASAAGSVVAWAGPWEHISEGGTFVYSLASVHHYAPIVVTGLASNSEGRRLLPEDDAVLITALSEWVAEHPVAYLGFGVEVNMHLWEFSEEEFEWYVDIFADVVTEVHRVSPATKVFPGFQLERLRGLKGGVFGGEHGDPAWELLERFPTADAIGFSTYPGLVFETPGDIPADYYTEIRQHTALPLVFTEVGWPAGGQLAEWSGSPEEQAQFVTDWIPEIASVGEMVLWSFLWDQEAPPAFATIGLISSAGEERPGWTAWQSLADKMLP